MHTYVLSKDAEKDLREIAQYTLKEWGESTFAKYKSGLIKKFNDIGKNLVVERRFSKIFPQLQVTKYRFHYIFYLTEAVDKPIIIGVIHEQRHIVNRLKNRLE
ncbi:MAG: type II toxin-antitoxin system RelE/ParE family toxin [Gammaproteobacteria bacterium]|nr:type II toxin-antitoxin system RelE/ParE family toxin [Gammaproteobacteria bacterium]